MKKLASLAAAGALLLGMAGSVFAEGVVVINKGWAEQETGAEAIATTGGNKYVAGFNLGNITQSGDTTTGDATAVAVAQSTANQFTTRVWSDCECGVFVLNKGGALQATGAFAGVDTGSNKYKAGFAAGNISQSGDTTTGNATAVGTAQSWANIYTTKVGTWSWPWP